MPKPYPPEFRQRAIELARVGERSIGEVAESWGISESCLRSWLSQAEVDSGEKPGLSSDERPELVELRREKRRLEMENEILKQPPSDATSPARSPTSPGR